MSKNFDEDELREASDHLFYEIWMLKRLAAFFEPDNKLYFKATPDTKFANGVTVDNSTGIIKVSQNAREEDVRVINNALIEASAVHIRALLDFFYSKGRYDDILAEHFFASPDIWRNSRPQKSKDELDVVRNRVNKEVAHLTISRQKMISREWQFKKILDDINLVIAIFLELVPDNLLGDRWNR